MKTRIYDYTTLDTPVTGSNEADTSLFPPNFGENTTDFHTSKDEGHLHPKQSAHRASAAAPVAPYRHARLSAMKLAGDLQG